MGDLNLDKVLDELSKIDSRDSVKTIAALLLNELMKKEREIYLRETTENKANGYYERQLACFLGNLGLSIPRDRKSEFRPSILPAEWQKADESFQDFILNLVLQSYSPNRIKALLQSMNLPYSAEQIEEIKEDLYNKAKELKTRELSENLCAMFMICPHFLEQDKYVYMVF